MKRMRKLFAMLLIAAMVFSATSMAMAAQVTVPEALDGHTFAAYQIFTGTQAKDDEALGDAVWGSGIDSAAFVKALKENYAEIFVEETYTAQEVAEILSDMTAEANQIAKIAYECKTETSQVLVSGENELEPGYYLIVDTSIGSAEDDIAAYNAALLQVTESITIAVKTDAPSVEKKVEENVKDVNSETPDEENPYGEGYNDVADYNIGDSVSFAFYSKVPDMTYYDTYKMVFHDVMSEGLTLQPESIVVTIAGNELAPEDYTVLLAETTEETLRVKDACTFEIVITDLKAIAGVKAKDEIRIDFEAVLNENAVIGLPGNPNTVCLEYSSNPNESEETKTTPEDKVIVFTYEVDVTKINDNETAPETLEGAEFKLKNSSDLWAKMDDNGIVISWGAESDASVLKSDQNGFFKVVGLDDGVYYLKETKAPAGYNLLTEEIEFTITATTANGQEWSGEPKTALTALTITVGVADENQENVKEGALDTGVVTMNVINQAGSTLPETGGIGTTLFYIVGGVLVLGAIVLLVTKRRMRE